MVPEIILYLTKFLNLQGFGNTTTRSASPFQVQQQANNKRFVGTGVASSASSRLMEDNYSRAGGGGGYFPVFNEEQQVQTPNHETTENHYARGFPSLSSAVASSNSRPMSPTPVIQQGQQQYRSSSISARGGGVGQGVGNIIPRANSTPPTNHHLQQHQQSRHQLEEYEYTQLLLNNGGNMNHLSADIKVCFCSSNSPFSFSCTKF